MIASLLAMVWMIVCSPVSAQQPTDWQFVPGAVLSPNPAIPYMSQSVGAPSVIYDAGRNRFLMFFETRTATVDARCPQGVWGIGWASSPDGITWTPSATPAFVPTPGSGRPFSCVAAQPTTVFSPTAYGGNGGVLLFFKAEQGTDACAVIVPSWGCDQLTGFGRLQIELNAAGDVRRVFVRATNVIIPTTPTFGFPKLVQDGGIYRMLYQGHPDIWRTQSTTLNGFVAGTVELNKSVLAQTVSWIRNELYNPALLCSDDPVFDFATFVGGRATQGAVTVSGGWGKAIDQVWGAGAGFALDVTAQQEFTGNQEWRHWDVRRTTTGEYLIWFSERDLAGNSFIRFGATDLAFNNADIQPKVCP